MYMSISRQNSERLGGGGGGSKWEIVFSTGRVRSVCAQEVLFCIASPPHKLWPGRGWRRKNICEPYGNPWRLHSTARLASLVDVCLLFIPFCAFPLLPAPPPPGPNLCKSLTMSNISVSFFFLSFFLLQIGTYYGSAVLAVDLNKDG